MGSLAIQPNSRRAYAMAIALLALALAAQWSLRPVVGTQVPFLFLLPAVGIAAMWHGWRPALLVLVGGLVNTFFWMQAPGGNALATTAGQVATAGYLVAGSLLLIVGGRINLLRVRATDTADTLIEQVDDLQALHDLNARLPLLDDLPHQMQAVLDALCELQGADQGLLALCDKGATHLRVVASVGFAPEALQGDLLATPLGAAACGRAFAAGQPLAVVDTESDPGFSPYRELARREGFRAVYSRPLVHRSGEVCGVVSVHFARPRYFTPREQRLGDLCAGTASVLVERDDAMRRAVASSHRLEVALDTSAVPFCLLQPVRDAGDTIRSFRWDYVNAAGAGLMRRAPADITGKSVLETLTEGVHLDPELLPRMLEALRSHAPLHFETWVQGPQRRRWFDVIASPYDSGLAVWFSDVSERRQHEEALHQADRRKDEFLATLAHELRNPLAPIRQAALIARSPHATQEKKLWSYSVIERQVGHMAMLLDDLLDVSRITRGKLVLRKAPTALAEAVESALESARPLVEARHQHLETRLGPEAVYLEADRLRLAQVLSNLVTNASKYTPEGGHIALEARREDGWAVIEVSDDGSGIAPDALEAIFEMFTQVRGADHTRAGGLGIGLALSRGLVELHGGRLEARSPGLGQGSTFTVRLPCSAAVAAPPAPDVLLPLATPSLRVLVADDNRDAAQSLADLLRMEGHEVAVAFDGAEALLQFGEFAPEVALLDIGMPRMTGNEVAAAIRARPEGAGVLLVAITGWGQERDREAARTAGFDHHFTKPVNPAEVVQLLARQGSRHDRAADARP